MDADKTFEMLKVVGKLVGSVSGAAIVSLAMKAITPAEVGRFTAVLAKLGGMLAAGALGTVLADQAEKDIDDFQQLWKVLMQNSKKEAQTEEVAEG